MLCLRSIVMKRTVTDRDWDWDCALPLWTCCAHTSLPASWLLLQQDLNQIWTTKPWALDADRSRFFFVITIYTHYSNGL